LEGTLVFSPNPEKLVSILPGSVPRLGPYGIRGGLVYKKGLTFEPLEGNAWEPYYWIVVGRTLEYSVKGGVY